MGRHGRQWGIGLRCALPATFLIAAASAAVAAAPAGVVKIGLRNLSDKPLRRVPVTLSQVFKRGDIREGVVVRMGGKVVPAQVDVKRRYDDGSVRFALLSFWLPSLPAKGTAYAALADGESVAPDGPDVVPADLQETRFTAMVRLVFPGGTVRIARVRKMLENTIGDPPTWIRGPVATEWLLSGAPVDRTGKPDPDLNVRFHVRAHASYNWFRVSVVVENCWDTWAGNVRYDVAVTCARKRVFEKRALDHRPLSRWRKVFWYRGNRPPVHVIHDLAYLSSTGALPTYDRTLNVPERVLKGMAAAMAAGAKGARRWDAMERGNLTAYMPTTGGRPEIAPYPTWTVRCLLSMDPRARRMMLANGDLAGSWPIHVRARKTRRIPTLDARPKFWLDARGTDKPTWKPDRTKPGPKQVRLSPDLAHQPSLAYVPYLLTGDYYYLEEAYFWANYCLLRTSHHPRQGAKGILSGQIRGNAWGLRNIADAAWIAPDGDPESKYFDRKIRNNIAHRIRRMYGPPEYNRMGFWGIRTTSDARIQNPANPKWMVIAPWEHDYLIWSLHHLVELGWPDAGKVRDFLLRWRVGTLTHAPDFDPLRAAPYRMAVGEWEGQRRTPSYKVTFYEDWKKLGAENARLNKPGLPNYGGSYAYSARAAVVCGVDAGFPGAERALEWLDAHLPGHRKKMAADPAFAIVPGGAAAKPK